MTSSTTTTRPTAERTATGNIAITLPNGKTHTVVGATAAKTAAVLFIEGYLNDDPALGTGWTFVTRGKAATAHAEAAKVTARPMPYRRNPAASAFVVEV
jgi:hypothetical protein